MTAVLEAVAICKSFSGVIVLHDLEMQIQDGALFGLVGANGAGKTTALDVIGGQAMGDSGSLRVGGVGIRKMAAWARPAGGGRCRTVRCC